MNQQHPYYQGPVNPSVYQQNGQPVMGNYYYFQNQADPNWFRQQQEQKAYKKGLSRKALWLGVAMLLVQVFGTVLAFLIPVFVDKIFPGASTNGGVFYDAIEYAIYSPVSILLSFWIVAKLSRHSIGELIPFEGKSKKLATGCVLFSFLWIALGNLIAGWVGLLLPQVEKNMETLTGALPETPLELILYILHVAAIPALVEEFAFRGVALGMLRPYGDRFALVASSVLFALLHGNFIQIPFAFCVGLALGYAVIRTGSMWSAIVLHFINNAFSCLITYGEDFLETHFGDFAYIGIYGLWLLLGVIGFLVLRLGGKEKLSACYQPYAGCISVKRRNGAFYCSVTILIAMAVYLGTAILLCFPLQ
jgi:membrane protease YdiL (CAAX protease family)